MLVAHPDLRFRPPSEKEVQATIVRLFRIAGAVVRSMSQYRASHVAVGIADLLCHDRGLKASWWFEVKPPLARWRDTTGNWVRYHPMRPATWKPRELDPAQITFRDDVQACGGRHFWGDLRAAEEALIALGRGSRLANGVLQIGIRRAG